MPLMGEEKTKREKESGRLITDCERCVHVHGRPRLAHIYSYKYVDVCTLPGRCTE